MRRPLKAIETVLISDLRDIFTLYLNIILYRYLRISFQVEQLTEFEFSWQKQYLIL